MYKLLIDFEDDVRGIKLKKGSIIEIESYDINDEGKAGLLLKSIDGVDEAQEDNITIIPCEFLINFCKEVKIKTNILKAKP